MSDTTDSVHQALDRLAAGVDAQPVVDPMPGITRRARASRQRIAVLTAGAAAIAVAAAVGVVSLVELPGLTRDLRHAGPADSPPVASTPTSSPDDPALAEYDRARADVDGDGVADLIQVRVPEADASEGQGVGMMSEDVRLRVELATNQIVELELGKTLAPTISQTPDLDRNGTAEVVLSFSGGDAGWLKTFTWHRDTVVLAEPATDSPADLVDDGGLRTTPEVASSALVDGNLTSWVGTGDTSAPYEVRVWIWQLDRTRLVAAETKETRCMTPGKYPGPC